MDFKLEIQDVRIRDCDAHNSIIPNEKTYSKWILYENLNKKLINFKECYLIYIIYKNHIID
jgi:hypothetical protein